MEIIEPIINHEDDQYDDDNIDDDDINYTSFYKPFEGISQNKITIKRQFN